jgi:hypothetical protein
VRSNGRICWLWCCFTVFLTACGHTLLGATTPTQTLLTFSTPTFKPTAILGLFRTPTLRSSGTAIASVTTQKPLMVEMPICYGTSVGSAWCFGVMRNISDVPLEKIAVRIYLITIDGKPLVEEETYSVHEVLFPGKASIYGVLFDTMPEEAVGIEAVLINAVPLENQNHVTDLVVSNIQYDNRDGVYHVTALLTNVEKQMVRDVNVIVTLLNKKRQVTGYRQQRLIKPLAGGQSIPFELEVIPQGTLTQIIDVSAQAWR